MSKELSLGRIARPFLERPFPSLCISLLGFIPKKTQGEFRLIHHLPFPYGDSINSCIPNDASRLNTPLLMMRLDLSGAQAGAVP